MLTTLNATSIYSIVEKARLGHHGLPFKPQENHRNDVIGIALDKLRIRSTSGTITDKVVARLVILKTSTAISSAVPFSEKEPLSLGKLEV